MSIVFQKPSQRIIFMGKKLTCFLTILTNKNKDKKVEENKQKIYLHENMESKQVEKHKDVLVT